jgi:hypothetical protein
MGPGQYDDIAGVVRDYTKGKAVIVAVVEGSRGNGFSIQTTDPTILLALPQVLRHIAESIEGDLRQQGLL